MRVLVCGSRNWTDRAVIRRELKALPKDAVIIEGEARGADTIAREEAEKLGLTVERYPANWEKYRRAAGPIRNRQMLVEGKPDWVLAFSEDIDNSKGTRNMVDQAVKAGLVADIIFK